MKSCLIWLLICAWAPFALAKTEAVKAHANPNKEVLAALAGYRSAPAIQAKVEKTVAQETMGTENKSQGIFYFSKGKLRLDILQPEKTSLVYDGKNIWFESRLDDEHVTVTKMRANQLRKSDSILAALFDKKDVLHNFALVKNQKDGDKKSFSYKAKDKKSDVQFLEIDLDNRDIEKISYKDQIENSVTLKFSHISRAALPVEKFAYKPPKNSEVTEP
jgi:outer membrane lipoprotein-sorting protein